MLFVAVMLVAATAAVKAGVATAASKEGVAAAAAKADADVWVTLAGYDCTGHCSGKSNTPAYGCVAMVPKASQAACQAYCQATDLGPQRGGNCTAYAFQANGTRHANGTRDCWFQWGSAFFWKDPRDCPPPYVGRCKAPKFGDASGCVRGKVRACKTDEAAAAAAAAVSVDIRAAAPLPPSAFPHFWSRVFGSGHGALTLRPDWQNAATEAADELGLQAVRFHGLFDEDMRIVTRDAAGKLVYNWTSIDASFDFMMSVKMVPKIELSFFPAVVSNCTAWMPTMGERGETVNPGHAPCKQGFFCGGIMSVPAVGYDASGWVEFVAAFAAHISGRYTAAVVETWRFEVWNELGGLSWGPPSSRPGNTTYMSLWNATATAMKSVNPKLRVGGPATEQLQYITEFVDECSTNSLPCDFVSSHLYPSDPQCPQTAEMWDPSCFSRLVKGAQAKVPASMEFFVTEMSVTVKYPEKGGTGCAGCDQHDTSASAAFLFRVLGEISGPMAPDAMSWWTFSDVFQEHNISRAAREQGLPQTEFSSAYGLQSISGVRKPGWRAFELMHQSGDLKVESVTSSEFEPWLPCCYANPACPGCVVTSPFHAFATMEESAPGLGSLMVFLSLWGNPYATTPAPNRSTTVNIMYDLSAKVAPSTIWATIIDSSNANPHGAWQAMGSPAVPSAAQLSQLHAASELHPEQLPLTHSGCTLNTTTTCTNLSRSLHAALELSPNTAVLLSFKKPTSSKQRRLKHDDGAAAAATISVDVSKPVSREGGGCAAGAIAPGPSC